MRLTTVAKSLLALVIAAFAFVAVNAQPGWILLPKSVDGDLVAVFFTSSDKGWIAGDNGFLASTTDGGRTWTKYPLNATEDIKRDLFSK